jgi:alanine racemase
MASADLNIDLDALAANWRTLNRKSAASVETGAVVKADGYGLGVVRVARALARTGARKFFVAQAEEGADLRLALGPGPEIILFSGHMAGDSDMIGDLDLIPMLNSVDQISRHFETLPKAAFGIQLDTGMNRLGLEPDEWSAVRQVISESSPHLVMSHLACADTPKHPMNIRQLDTFREMTAEMNAPLSLAATGGILLGENYHFDVTRPGIGLYGGEPYSDAKQVVSLTLPVIQTREVAADESVGYGWGWSATQPTRVATLGAGYADGLIRALGNSAYVYADDIACPVIGRVSMDMITVDITELDHEPKTLDIISPYQSIDTLAGAANTIGYEVLTSLGSRYARRYSGAGL